jgi:nucleoside-diphosphate-sugar epimerase
MKVLVLGSSGFVGKNLVTKLINANYNLKLTSRKKINNKVKNTEIVEVNLLDPNLNFKELINNCETIINCAGEINNENKMYDLHVSFIIKLYQEIIEKYKYDQKKINFIQLSSVGVYGPPKIPNQNRIINELSTSRKDIMSVYEKTKLLADQYILDNFNSKIINYCILRPSQIIGDYMPNESLSQLYNIINKKLFFYIGKRNSIRAYIHIDDVTDSILLILKNINGIAKNKIYNISYDNYLEDIVEKIIKANKLNYKPLRFPENFIRFIILSFNIFKIRLPLTIQRINGLVSRTKYDSNKIINELNFTFNNNPVDKIINLKR